MQPGSSHSFCLCVNGGCSGIQGSEGSSFGPSPRTSGEKQQQVPCPGHVQEPQPPLGPRGHSSHPCRKRGAQLGSRTPESLCRSGEPPGFRMVKDWDPEGFNLLTSQKPTALEEDRAPALCLKALAPREGNRPRCPDCPSTVQDGGAAAPEEGFVSRDLVGCVGYMRPSSIWNTLVALRAEQAYPLGLQVGAAPVLGAFFFARSSLTTKVGDGDQPPWEPYLHLPTPQVDFCAFGFQSRGWVPYPNPVRPGKVEGGCWRTPLKPQASVFPLEPFK